MTDSAQPADMTASERDAYEELLVALDSRALYLRELFGIFSETDVSALTGHDPRTLHRSRLDPQLGDSGRDRL